MFTVKNRRFGLNLHLPIPSCAYMKLHAAQPIDIWKPIRHLKAHFHSLEEMNVLEEMNAFNMSVVSMPQSHHYTSAAAEAQDARLINCFLDYGVDPKLMRRLQNSCNTASTMYPPAEHMLAPGVVFLIGPVLNNRAFTKDSIRDVDILLLLRTDKESKLRGKIKKQLQTFFLGRDHSWKLVDWDTRRDFLKDSLNHDRGPIHVMTQVAHSGVFDYNRRFESSVDMFSTASVVDTYRLHSSIFAFLMGKPHVISDDSKMRLTLTREAAFQTSEAPRHRSIQG